MELYKAALATALGRHSQRPYRAALVRIATLAVLATGSSFALAHIAGQLPLTAIPRSYLLVPAALLAMQLVVLCALLTASGITQRMYTDGFARWLLLLPINPIRRWAVLMTPSVLLAGLAMLLAAWPLTKLWLQLGMSPLFVALGSAGGAVCALGLFYALPLRLSALKFVVIPYVLWVEYKLVNIISNPANTSHIAASYAFIALVITLTTAWLWSSRYVRIAIAHNRTSKSVSAAGLPPRWWYIKKIVRSPAVRLSSSTGLGLIAALVVADRSYGIGTQALALGAAIIVAAFVSDIRALTRRVAPSEITALRGSGYFMAVHIATATLGGIITALPLLIHLGGVTFSIVAPLLTGIAAGLFTGNLLTPSSRDISGQFLSGLMCIGILVFVPYLPGVQAHSALQPAAYLGMAGVLLLVSYWIEYKRNPYIWRTRHA